MQQYAPDSKKQCHAPDAEDAAAELRSTWEQVGLITFDFVFFFFSSRRRHTRSDRDWSSDVCSSDLLETQYDIRLNWTVQKSHKFGTNYSHWFEECQIATSFEQCENVASIETSLSKIGRASCRERV